MQKAFSNFSFINLHFQLWCTHHHPDDVEKACRGGLKTMNLDYFDLYLMHWPFAFKVNKV